MSRQRFYYLIFLLLFGLKLLSTDGHAADKVLDLTLTDQASVSLTEYFAVLEDPSSALTLADVQDPKIAAQFKTDFPAAEDLNFGYSHSAYWFRLAITNGRDSAIDRLLEIAYARLVDVQMHQPGADGNYRSLATGVGTPFSTRPYKNKNYVFPVTLAAHASQTIYIRVKSIGPVIVPAKLWTYDAFRISERENYSYQAAYFGMAIAMVLFNLLLFVAIRDVLYLRYILFVACMALTIGTHKGLTAEFLWPDSPFWAVIAINVGYSLAFAAFLTFMRHMLMTKQIFPQADRLVRVLVGFYLLSPLGFAVCFECIVRPFALLYLITGLLILFIGTYCALQGQRTALTFVVAFAVLCFGGFATALRSFGLLPTNALTVNGMQIGSALEMILLAFALADRFNVLRRQKEQAQEAALIAQERIVEALKSSERILETRVEERTHDYLIAKEAAESANLAKSRFLAAASHDLRQPIQAINMFCMALAGSTLDKEQKQISDYLSVSAGSLGDILNSLLDISKLEAGNVDPEPEAIQIKAIFRSINAEFAPMANAKRLRFMLYFPVGEMAVFTDPRLLHRLLGNLVGNAVKYTERGGVLVGLRRRGQHALIQVWDSGIGIAPEHMSHLFDDYFQVGNPGRDKSKGLGLGLAIAKRLAQRLGTELICRSRPNKGSVFELRLPLASASLEIGPIRVNGNESNRAAWPELKGQRIVVIDDDEAVAKSIKLSLERQGMIVTIHGTAEQALANPEIAAADFYISDMRLPGLNGAELLNALQQRSAKPINAVILTGDTSPVRVAIARASRWPVLLKPVDLPELISAIESRV